MGTTRQFSARRQQTASTEPANSSPARQHLRTGFKLSGAFLLLVTIFAGIQTQGANNSLSTQSTAQDQQSPIVQQPASRDSVDATQPIKPIQEEAMTNKSSGTSNTRTSSQSSSVSTNVTTVNGETKVQVNGQDVPLDENGEVSKTINRNSSSVQINISSKDGSM